MKSTKSITTLLFCAAILVAFATSLQAQLDHNMIFRVNGPAVVAGDYNYGPPADGGNAANRWGPTSINTITGDLEWISDNVDSLGCNPAVNSLAGKIALVRRGNCNFSLKVYHAQAQGAVGCVICNNAPGGGTVNMLGGDSMSAITIPAVFLTYEDCDLLAQQVDAGTTTNASFYVPSVYDAVSSYAYNTPLQHVRPINGLRTTLYNSSTGASSNVDVTATITDPSGTPTVLTETLANLPGTYDSTVTFSQPYTPSTVGTYNITFKSTLNQFDSVTQQFVINNDSTFALDNNNFTPSGNLGGIGPTDADFAAADVTGTTFLYEMGATYVTGLTTPSDANSITFALQNANTYVGKDFIILLYEEPVGGFVGTAQDYSTFNLIGGGLYNVQPSDTMAPHTLMNAPLFEISNGTNVVAMDTNKQYMAVVRHAGDGTITVAPRISYTHIQDFVSFAATTYVDRLYMAGWNPSYAPVIRLNVAPLVTSIQNTPLEASATAVFPSPADNQVNLKISLAEISDNVAVKLVDLNGKILQAHTYSNVQNATYQYNVQDLAAGVYLLHVQTDKGQSMKKVVIK